MILNLLLIGILICGALSLMGFLIALIYIIPDDNEHPTVRKERNEVALWSFVAGIVSCITSVSIYVYREKNKSEYEKKYPRY